MAAHHQSNIHVGLATRPRLSGDCDLNPGWGVGGWVRGQKKVCVPKIHFQFRAPLISFSPEENFSDVGGWVGGSGGGAQAGGK